MELNNEIIIEYIVSILEAESMKNKVDAPIIEAIISEIKELEHKDEYGILCMPVMLLVNNRNYNYEDITKVVVKCIGKLERTVDKQIKKSIIYNNIIGDLKNYASCFSVTAPILLSNYDAEEKNKLKEKGNNKIEEVKEDVVNHPKHYKKGSQGLECIESMEKAFSEDEYRGFLKLNAYKYVYRHESKNGLEDLNKAEFYLNKLFDAQVDDEYKKQREILYTIVLNVHKNKNYKEAIKGMVLENIIKEDFMMALIGIEKLKKFYKQK